MAPAAASPYPVGAVEDAGPYKGLGESAPVSGGASMRAAGDAGPYGSESGAVSKFENISKRTDTSTTRAGATRGGITNNIKNHEASQKPPLRSNGAAHYRAERGSGSDKRSVSDSLYDDPHYLGFRVVHGHGFQRTPAAQEVLKPAVSGSVFGHFWGCGQK